MADTTEVHLIFTGIVGFVPIKGGLTVVVQDATGPGSHMPHTPHVVIETGGYKSHKGIKELRSDNRSLRGFQLKQYAVSVKNSIEEDMVKEEASFREFALLVGGGCPASLAECGAILKDLLNGPVPKTVAARFPLPNGSLQTTFVDPKVQWHFAGFSGAPKFLAEEICHSFHIEEKILTLRFAKKVDDPDPDELQVKVPDREKTIEVRIGNLPKALVFSRGQDWVCEDDHHVKLYYELSKVKPGQAHGLKSSEAPTPLPDPPQLKHTHRLTPEPPREDKRAMAQDMCLRMVHGPNCPPALWARAS